MDVLISKNALLEEFEWLLSVVNESSKDDVRDTIQRIENATTILTKEEYEELIKYKDAYQLWWGEI